MTKKMIEAKKNERPNALKEMRLLQRFWLNSWDLI
jgi:hypothetical protein